MRKPSSLKKRLFPLERIPHFRDGFPPLINKNLSDSSWPEKKWKMWFTYDPNYNHIIIIFFEEMVSALCSFKIWSHTYRSHGFWDKRSLQHSILFKLFNLGYIIQRSPWQEEAFSWVSGLARWVPPFCSSILEKKTLASQRVIQGKSKGGQCGLSTGYFTVSLLLWGQYQASIIQNFLKQF